MLHERHAAWIEARGISIELAEKLGLSTVARDGANWLAVPYVENGKTINHKYRMTSEKRHMMDPGAPLTLWNFDAMLEDSDKPLVICEGEWDAMVAIAHGWRAVSVPNGAPAGETPDLANSKRYEFMWRCRDMLNRQKSFILATDDDAPGKALRSDLAALLGADRCSFLDYPFPSKDLNEVLIEHGHEAVSTVLARSKAYPVRGLYGIDDFPEDPPLAGIPVGIKPLAGKIEIVPGTLTILTGYSNSGKTTLMNTIVGAAINAGVTVAVASFETPPSILVNRIARSVIGCSAAEFEDSLLRKVTMDDLRAQLRIISNALDDELEFDIESFLDVARISVIRDGMRMLVIDPWNELEHKRRRDETLTEYIGRAIRAVKRFAKQHKVAVWILAHPTKPMRGTNGPPSLYDVSDSAHWANKADYGIVHHRPDRTKNEALIDVAKVRMGLPGECCQVEVKFDYRVSRITGIHD